MQQRRRLSSAPARMHPVLAAILATTLTAALVAVAAVGGQQILQVQSVAPASMDVYSATDSFASGADVEVDDAAVSTQGAGDEHRVVKEFTRDHEFSMFGLTWFGDRDIVAFVRSQRADNSWTDWFEMDLADSPDGTGKSGTEPIYVEPTKRIQVSTANVDLLEGGRADSEAQTTAKDLDAVFIDGGTGTANGDVKQVANSYAAAMPKVITRAQWGAGNSAAPTYTEPVSAATVHHTAGSNDYTEAQAPGIVRGIWQYHALTLGWNDIGYNALVDKYGNIYEGRAGGLDRAVEGAHVGGFNENTWGVSMLGNYQIAQPTQAAINAMGEIIGWKAAVAGFDPLGSSYLRAEFNFNGSRYTQGQGAMFPNINAHRDFHYNTCPGDNLYARMGEIRLIAKKKYNEVRAGGAITGGGLPSNPSLSNPNGTTTTVTPGNAQLNLPTTDVLAGLSSGDPVSVATAAGTVAGAALLYGFQKGLFDDRLKTLAGTEIISGVTVQDVVPYIAPALQVTLGPDAANTWRKIEPRLGEAVGAVSGIAGQQIAFYSGGFGVRNENGELFTLVDEFANAWLQQGLDLGPLGMPTSQAIETGDDEVRMTFEGGAIVYTPSTKTVNIQTN